MEVPGIVLDRANVSSTGGFGVVTTLHFLQHDLPQMCHEKTSFSATQPGSAHLDS